MTRYSYAAVASDGHAVTGITKAVDRDAAELDLLGRDYSNIRLLEKRSILQMEIGGTRVKREEVMHLSRQLGAFIKAGLPLIEAVHTLGTDAHNPTMRKLLADVEARLHDGETLSACLDRHPKVFPEYYRGILRSAELTGQLDVVLEQLARYMERDLAARRKVKSAMIYPAIIAVMSIITVVVLATFVLPKFKDYFAGLDAKLPLATRMLLAITDFVTEWGWAIGAGLVAFLLLVFLVLRTEGGRRAKDHLVLHLPVLGGVVRYALIERFCRILASMVGAGVPLPEALRVATESVHNRVFTVGLRDVGDALLEGEGISQPLVSTGLFPPTAAQMMRVGEETGTLDTQLELTAEYYEGELEYRLAKMTSLIEPTVIVAMGVLVGFVAIALVSAMYGVFGQVKV